MFRSICKNLHELVKEDIRKVREARKSFEKMSGDLDQALTRNAAASKIKGVSETGDTRGKGKGGGEESRFGSGPWAVGRPAMPVLG